MNLFGKPLGQLDPPIYIAEISCNHGGSLVQAKELIQAAKEAGADAVKIQTYQPEDMTLALAYNDDFDVKDGLWAGRNLWELYRETGTPYEWLHPMFEYAKSINIPLFSSVFSHYGVGFLEEVGNPVYKIASFENNDEELIKRVVATKKPVIISTGMAYPLEIQRIVNLVNPLNTVLMHCVSAYPCETKHSSLYKINVLRGFYPCIVGFSDHTTSCEAAMTAIALGAKVIEKHMTLNFDTEDKEFSVDPISFKLYIGICNDVHESIRLTKEDVEASSRQFRRSLYVVKDVAEGEKFTDENVRAIRPSYGLEPYRYQQVLGKTAKENIKAGTALTMELVVW